MSNSAPTNRPASRTTSTQACTYGLDDNYAPCGAPSTAVRDVIFNEPSTQLKAARPPTSAAATYNTGNLHQATRTRPHRRQSASMTSKPAGGGRDSGATDPNESNLAQLQTGRHLSASQRSSAVSFKETSSSSQTNAAVVARAAGRQAADCCYPESATGSTAVTSNPGVINIRNDLEVGCEPSIDLDCSSPNREWDTLLWANKLAHIENDLMLRSTEVEAMREEILKAAPSKQCIQEVKSLKYEVERLRIDKNALTSMIRQLQDDLCNKESNICCLETEINNLRKCIVEKDNHLSFFQERYAQYAGHAVNFNPQQLEEFKQRAEIAEQCAYNATDAADRLESELRRMKADACCAKQLMGKLKAEHDELADQNKAMEAGEKLSAENAKKTSNALTRLRSRLASALGAPCTTAAAGEFGDDQLLERTKLMVDEHTSYCEALEDARKTLAHANAVEKQLLDTCRKVRDDYNATLKNACTQRDLRELIRQQSEIFQSGIVHRNLVDIKSVLLSMSQSQLDLLRELYDAFELAGINTQSENGPKSPSQFVQELASRVDDYRKQMVSLKQQIEKTAYDSRRVLEEELEKCRREQEAKYKEKLQCVCNQYEADQLSAISQALSNERKKVEASRSAHNEKVGNLEEALSLAEQELQAKDDELEFYKEQERLHLLEIEAYRKVEVELRDQIVAKESSNSESLACIEDCLRKKYERELECYKEQIGQQQATIAAHQDRLNKALKAARKSASSGQIHCDDECSKQSVRTNQLVDKLKVENSKLQMSSKKLSSDLTQCRIALSDKDLRIRNLCDEVGVLQAKLMESKHEMLSKTELTDLGACCRDERHRETISMQRDAISELRKAVALHTKLKLMTSTVANQTSITGGFDGESSSTGPQAANQHRSEPTGGDVRGCDDSKMQSTHTIDRNSDQSVRQLSSTYSPTEIRLSDLEPIQANYEKVLLDHQKQQQRQRTTTAVRPSVNGGSEQKDKLKEAYEILALSEVTYLNLVRKLVMTLDIDVGCAAIRPLTDLCVGEERVKFCQQRSSGENAIVERVEQLIKTSVCQSEKIDEMKRELRQLRFPHHYICLGLEDDIEDDLCRRVDENRCLIAMLEQVREDLAREKRLNAAVKCRKVSVPSAVERCQKPTVMQKNPCRAESGRLKGCIKPSTNCGDSRLRQLQDVEIECMKKQLDSHQNEIRETKARFRRIFPDCSEASDAYDHLETGHNC